MENKTIRKVVSVFLIIFALGLMSVGLTACGDDSPSDSNENGTNFFPNIDI